MAKRITKFGRDPFTLDVKRGGWWLVHPATRDILFGSAAMRASKGLAFSVVRGAKGYLLKLRYSNSSYDIGFTNDAENAMRWVEEVNAFLATKHEVLQADTPIYVARRDAANPLANVAKSREHP